MANDTTSSVVTFRKRALTGAERQKHYRQRQKQKALAAQQNLPSPVTELPVVLPLRVTSPVSPVTSAVTSRPIGSTLLVTSAFALAAVGVTMNGWFARSLGSTDLAGWLFLAIGVAADCVALAAPSVAARLWHGRQRASAGLGWLVWLATFMFAVTAGIGFASLNISDVTVARASRVTPAVASAQTALGDAMAARDRECKGGVGKFCRERESAVATARSTLDGAMKTVEAAADPQTEAAMKIVAWISAGTVKPTSNDFAMLRLVLLALLPQIGGILLMLGRARPAGTT